MIQNNIAKNVRFFEKNFPNVMTALIILIIKLLMVHVMDHVLISVTREIVCQ